MPNNDDVLIVGSLKDEELRKSIDNLVDYVGDKTNEMAMKFNDGLDKMKLAMKDFAVTQKVSVDLMKQAWREMSTSFDAMVAAQSGATGGGSGGGKPAYPDNTIGALEQEIALLEKERKEMVLNTDELRTQNRIIEARKNILKSQKESNTSAKESKQATKELGEVMSKSTATLSLAQSKLYGLENIQRKYIGSVALTTKQFNRLEDAIERTKQKIQKLRSAGTSSSSGQPMSFFDVKNLMPEESIDEITRKMKALKGVKTQDAVEAKALGDEYQRLKRRQAELLGMNIQHTKSNNYLAQSFGYIRNRIVYALTLGAITNFTKQIYEIRSQYELLERSLGVLVNSFERGSQVFLELNKMALESPFTLMELAGAAKQLTAYNFAAKEVVDTTRRLADISAALGVPMERLTYNLGQIRAQTVLTARDARDFANAGLPVVASLAEHFSQLEGKIVTTGDVYDRMSKKMVSYSDVMAVLNSMTDEGGKFFDFQAKQAETLRVQLANLTLAWNNMLNEMGTANQGLLTFPVGVLKSILKNWQAIDRVIKSIILSYGIIKVAQIIAIRNQMAWATAASATAKQMGFVANMVNRAVASMSALLANPWTWAFVGVLALVDLVQGLNNARIATKELNEEIRNNANEASENMLKFLNNKGSKATLELAQAGKLTAEQGDKAWAAIREQIETSAMSCEGLIAELLTIDDINERVAKGFDYSERIQKAQAALQDLGDTDIKVTQDLGWFGMFGEGLVSDLKDYADDILEFEGTYQELQDILTTDKGTNMDLKVHFEEFKKELGETAESINNYITAYGITDPLQINEILERVRAQIKAKNPEIKGEAAKLFDLELDKKMSELTNNAVDANSTLWKMFMDRLKRQSSATFTDINEDWIRNGKALSKEQQDAVDQNLQYFKDSMPYAYDAVAKMVSDASNLKIHIGITFGTAGLTDFQKEVNKRIEKINNEASPLDFGNNAMLPTQNDDLSSWVKTQQQAIKNLGEQNKKYQKDNTEWSQQKIKDNDREIQQRKNLLDLFNQSYNEDKKSGGSRKKDADVVAEAINQELKLIKEMQSNYEKLRKAGVENMEAIDLASRGYEGTIKRINNVLEKFGVSKFNAGDFAGKNVHDLLDTLNRQRDSLIASGKVKTASLQALDVEIQKLKIDAKTYDMKKVTDGLNNELAKVKEEYELAVEFDANPELGGVFADMMGINKDELNQLPRTYEQVVAKLQTQVDKLFADNHLDKQFDLVSLLNKNDFEAWAKAQGNTLDDSFIKALDNIRQYANKVRLDEASETTKNWSSLVEKYGDLQAKLVKIAKQTGKEQLNIIKKFGTENEKQQALGISEKLNIEQDPETVARLQRELIDLMNRVVQGNPQAVNIATATENEGESLKSKAFWEDFKQSELYSMTFEDMSRVSTSAIQLIIDKLEELRGKVQEDPASMKALTKSLEDARKELEGRSGTLTIVNALKEYKTATTDLADARQNLAGANSAVADAENQLNEAEQAGDATAVAKAVDNLRRARERQKEAEEDVVRGENNVKKSTKKLQAGMETLSSELQNIQGLFDVVAKLFAAGGDDETAEAISAISQGFTIMTTIIMGVVAAMVLLESTQPWLLAIAAALSVIVGLVSWLSGSNKKEIDEQVKASEVAVKRLENSYKNLEVAVENAIGAQVIAFKKAEIANKKLQLVELQRQLQLEKSRDSKDRDDSKIADLEGQIIEMRNEIRGMSDDVTNAFLGINSVSDAVKSMMDEIVDALRDGEDAMGKFDESIDEMVANMIKQVFSARILGPMLENIWNQIDRDIQERGKGLDDQLAKLQRTYDYINTNTNDTGEGYYYWLDKSGNAFAGGFWDYMFASFQEGFQAITYETWKSIYEQQIEATESALKKATTPTMDDVRKYASGLREVSPELEQYMDELYAILDEMGLIKDQTKENALSKLQQGIEGVTEDTAGAIEAYMNIVSQRVFEQNEYLMQIRDIIVNFDLDVQVDTMGQMLLQLQQSYQVQQAIQARLDGWSNANGMAVRVEMV